MEIAEKVRIAKVVREKASSPSLDKSSVISLGAVSKSINPKLRLYRRMEQAAKDRED